MEKLKGHQEDKEDCLVPAIGKMSGCITPVFLTLYSRVVGGAGEKKKTTVPSGCISA